MSRASFLKIRTTLSEAWNLDESPVVDLHYLDQIQLLPKDPHPYTQITDSPTDLSVGENYQVFLVNCTTGEYYEITDHIDITNVFIDSISQLKIRIAYLPNDHYSDLMHLRIVRDSVSSFSVPDYYSNPFLVTDTDSHLTTRIDYFFGNIRSVFGHGSIRLKMYENNYSPATELKSYFQVTTGQLTNSRTQIRKYQEWQTAPWNAFTFKKLEEALYFGRCYFDLVRQYPSENIPYAPRQGTSNISEITFVTDPNPLDTIKIQEVIIGATMIDFRVNAPDVRVNTGNYLITQTQIPA